MGVLRRALASKNQPNVMLSLLVLDLALNAVAPKAMLDKHYEHLRVQPALRPLLNPIKAASAVGFLAGKKWPKFGVLTAAATVVYFVCAFGYHRRVRDNLVITAPAVLYGGVAARALAQFFVRSRRA